MATERLYKFLRKDGTGPYSGQAWALPTDDVPGEWMPEITGALVACKNGYHLCREQDAVQWINIALYEAEYDGERVDAADKIVARRARLLRRVAAWNERAMRLFACDCAEHVLDLFERRCPGEDRPRQAIAVARRYANGEATFGELQAAQRDAYDAADAAAYDAADAAAAYDAADTRADGLPAATSARKRGQK